MNYKFLLPLFFVFQVAHAQNPFIRHMYTADPAGQRVFILSAGPSA